MENYFKFHKMSPLENMMSNILAEGKDNVWKWMETIDKPLKRIGARQLYFEALNKIEKGK